MGFRKELRNKTKIAIYEENCLTAFLVSAPGTSSFTALRGEHSKPDFQEDYKRFASFIQEVFCFSAFLWALVKKTCIWLLSFESNCNQPQILLPHGDLDKSLQNKMLMGRYRTGLVRASTKLPAPEIQLFTLIAGSPHQAGFGVGYLFLLDW